jgi:hypothetical protein
MRSFNTDLFEKTELTTLSTSYVTTTHEYRDSINDISSNTIQDIESDISGNFAKINDISSNTVILLKSSMIYHLIQYLL